MLILADAFCTASSVNQEIYYAKFKSDLKNINQKPSSIDNDNASQKPSKDSTDLSSKSANQNSTTLGSGMLGSQGMGSQGSQDTGPQGTTGSTGSASASNLGSQKDVQFSDRDSSMKNQGSDFLSPNTPPQGSQGSK